MKFKLLKFEGEIKFLVQPVATNNISHITFDTVLCAKADKKISLKH